MVATLGDGDGRRRSVEVRVKLSPAIAERFNQLAEGLGLLPATLAAVAVGEYVAKADQNAEVVRLMSLDMSRRFSTTLDDPDYMAKAMGQLFANPEAMAALSASQPAGEAV